MHSTHKMIKRALSLLSLSVVVLAVVFVMTGCSFGQQIKSAVTTLKQQSDAKVSAAELEGYYEVDGTIIKGSMKIGSDSDGCYASLESTINDQAYNALLRVSVDSNGSLTLSHDMYSNGNQATNYTFGSPVLVLTRDGKGLKAVSISTKAGVAHPNDLFVKKQQPTNKAEEKDETQTQTVVTQDYKKLWTKDLYGWWYIRNGTGAYSGWENSCWDACARISVSSSGNGYILLWDSTTSAESPLAKVWITIKKDTTGKTIGKAISTDGYFYDTANLLDYGAWVIDPNAYKSHKDFYVIKGTYTTHDKNSKTQSSFDYTFYLRPWGEKWNDFIEAAENLEYQKNEARRDALDLIYWREVNKLTYDDVYVPPYVTVNADIPNTYNSWYLPLIEKGEGMPSHIQSKDTTHNHAPSNAWVCDNKARP